MSWAAIVVAAAIASGVIWQSYKASNTRTSSTDASTGQPEIKSTGVADNNLDLNRGSKKDLPPSEVKESQDVVDWSYPAEPIRREFDALMNGEDQIDDFILRHLKRAEAGDENSAIYLAEAMRYCSMELISLDMTRKAYGIEATGAPEVREAIMDNLIGKPEFYRTEAFHHIDRAIACERLDWSRQYHLDTANEWEKFAREKGQPLATARAASVGTGEMTPEQLDKSKQAIRNSLTQSHDLRVLLYSSIVASAATGSDFQFERLAWALLSCEYESCDGLNYLYRGTCEIMTLQGSHICSEDMTDLDYLFRKYPSRFDAARARASEIHDAIDNEQWELIGLR